MPRIEIPYTRTLPDDTEIELIVACDYSSPQPGRRYLSNGDPGYPDEPETFEVVEAWTPDKSPLPSVFPEWSEGETETLRLLALEMVAQNVASMTDDEADAELLRREADREGLEEHQFGW